MVQINDEIHMKARIICIFYTRSIWSNNCSKAIEGSNSLLSNVGLKIVYFDVLKVSRHCLIFQLHYSMKYILHAIIYKSIFLICFHFHSKHFSAHRWRPIIFPVVSRSRLHKMSTFETKFENFCLFKRQRFRDNMC